DADFAFFERGLDEAELARGRDLFLHAADEAFADEGLKEADRKAILDAVGKLLSPAPLAYASGLDLDVARKALAVERSRGDLSDPLILGEVDRASAEALLGWRVIACDEPASRWMAPLKDLAAALGRPTVTAAYRASASGAPPPALYAAPMPKGVTLPAGAQHYVFELPLAHGSGPSAAAGAAAKPTSAHPVGKALAIHLLLVPDGSRTWFGLGAGDAPLASKLALAM